MERSKISRRRVLVGLGGGAALALTPTVGLASRRAYGDADPAVIRDWNATAVAIITVDAAKPGAEASMWFGFISAAVYNAVMGITRRYRLYRWNVYGPRRASPQAAAAAAAHRVLQSYFGTIPATATRLAAAYASSLAAIPDGHAKEQGLRYGERAADHFIALRANDGRNAPVTFDMAPAAGVWRPTPPANAPFFAPWLAQTEPLLVDSPSQFRPPSPPSLTSALYTEEFNEVKAYGAKTSTVRTARQTETALFVSNFSGEPLRAGMRDLTKRYGMDISDTARLFAAVDMSMADAQICCWDCKLHYGLWRPITAIRLADQDGNPATVADPTWEPLIVTPPYPDYNSGFNSITGALLGALTRVLGTQRIDLYVTSPATNTTRYYEFADQLGDDAVDGRIWSGIHFRTADVVALAMGKQVANWALDRYFRPR